MLDRQLRTAFDDVVDGVLVESRDRVAYVNRAYAAFLGYPSTTELFDASVSVSRIDGEVVITTLVRELMRTAPARFDARLSAREEEVLRHVLAGQRSKDIAALLNVSEKTVGTHRFRAFQKLGLRGELDLFRLAAERGLL